MRVGTVTLSTLLDENSVKKLMKINNFEMLFIQYKENSLYNVDRSVVVYGEHKEVTRNQHYNIIEYKGKTILQCNIKNEEELWSIVEEKDYDIVLGFFNEDADDSIHFEMTFEYLDPYKILSHEEELFPDFTDKINQIRDTWILTKEQMTSGVFELDALTNGVWVDVRD